MSAPTPAQILDAVRLLHDVQTALEKVDRIGQLVFCGMHDQHVIEAGPAATEFSARNAAAHELDSLLANVVMPAIDQCERARKLISGETGPQEEEAAPTD
jgi:chromosome condensin MukBEF MukE localization factor